MSAITTYPTVTRDEAKESIKALGAGNKELNLDPVTVLIMSEPGVGKTAILNDLRDEMGEDEYDFIYVDGPNKEMMDIAATIPNHETKSLEHYVAGLFKMGNGKKKVIMIDEALKAAAIVAVPASRPKRARRRRSIANRDVLGLHRQSFRLFFG